MREEVLMPLLVTRKPRQELPFLKQSFERCLPPPLKMEAVMATREGASHLQNQLKRMIKGAKCFRVPSVDQSHRMQDTNSWKKDHEQMQAVPERLKRRIFSMNNSEGKAFLATAMAAVPSLSMYLFRSILPSLLYYFLCSWSQRPRDSATAGSQPLHRKEKFDCHGCPGRQNYSYQWKMISLGFIIL
jgi:hypothetical protein